MISTDQPTCFVDSDLSVIVSSKSDGSMLNRHQGIHVSEILENRRAFCAKNSIDYNDVVYQTITYDDDSTYDHIEAADEQSTTRYRADLLADAIIVRSPGVGVLLPLADCIGVVVYGSRSRSFAVVHMGRHSTLTNLLSQVVKRVRDDGNRQEDLIAWMTPSVGRQSYRLEYFAAQDDPEWKPYHEVDSTGGIYIDLAGFNRYQLEKAGLLPSNIHISQVDTYTSPHYFSHSAGDATGRFALLAMMR